MNDLWIEAEFLQALEGLPTTSAGEVMQWVMRVHRDPRTFGHPQPGVRGIGFKFTDITVGAGMYTLKYQVQDQQTIFQHLIRKDVDQ